MTVHEKYFHVSVLLVTSIIHYTRQVLGVAKVKKIDSKNYHAICFLQN